MSRNKFILESNKIHNNIYDYQFIEYKNDKTKVSILCREHGIFNQLPNKHRRGQGCPKCASFSRRISVDRFIEKSSQIHSYKYDYSLVNYINHSTKVKIICQEHGIFEQTPNNHMCHKKGCSKCNGGVSYTFNDFVKKANKIHNNNFNYLKIENGIVSIICKFGHEFDQGISSHLKGSGCLECYNTNKKYSKEEFINACKRKHNDNYDYSLIDYQRCDIKVSIKCNNCLKLFNQRAKNHLSGQGCPKCSNKSISKMEIKWLDILNIPIENRHQTIRIGNKNIYVDAIVNNQIYEFYGDYWHGNPKTKDPEDINSNNGIKFGDLYQKTIERENTLKSKGYEIITIWESDFKKYLKENENIRNRTII